MQRAVVISKNQIFPHSFDQPKVVDHQNIASVGLALYLKTLALLPDRDPTAHLASVLPQNHGEG